MNVNIACERNKIIRKRILTTKAQVFKEEMLFIPRKSVFSTTFFFKKKVYNTIYTQIPILNKRIPSP